MINEFKACVCRFHTKDNCKLLITGHFEEDVIGNNILYVKLDGKELELDVEEKKRISGGYVKKTDINLTKEYFLWITLPSSWKESKKLQLFNSNGDETEVSFEITTSKLKKVEKILHKYIDDVSATNNGFSVKGWYVDNGDAEIGIFDTAGNPLEVNMKKNNRIDVAYAYPENAEEEIKGFEAVYNGKVPKKIRIHFEEGGKKADLEVQLVLSLVEKVVKKAKSLYMKAKVYYQQFGLRATILRARDKIARRDLISYKNWYKVNCPTNEMLTKQRKHKFAYQPKISIVIPLYKTPHVYLDEMIDSVKKQTYSNWELCLSDGSGENSPLTNRLKKYETEDSRIKVVYNTCALQISENTNAALEIVTGDYIAFADHDDLLAPNALYECVYELNRDKDIDIIYTDEDKIDMLGNEHFMPHFKPDFNIDMLRSINYICHLFVVKNDIVKKVGMLNPEFDGAQDYDFVLRCIETTSKIKHIPMILYHWRAHKDSTAENPESKEYAFRAGMRAIAAHYERVGIKATVEKTGLEGLYRSKYILQSEPLISIIIPNKDHIDDLDKCIKSIENRSSYRNYEFIIVENNSTDEKTFEYYKKLEEQCSRAKVVYWAKQGFNYPAINNYGVEHAKGEYILFLNNDTEIVNEDCIEELLGYCMREDVGAVGARLYYEDGTVQHAGVVVGLGGVAGHAFVAFPRDHWGYFGRIHMAQNYSAVTAACMLMKKSIFDEVGGFDEKYAVAFNDVDLCMKIIHAGYLIVYNPYAELNHYESKSRGYEDTEEKVKRFNSEIELFRTRWEAFLEAGDPCYSPNLTLDRNDFALNEQRYYQMRE